MGFIHNTALKLLSFDELRQVSGLLGNWGKGWMLKMSILFSTYGLTEGIIRCNRGLHLD